MVVAVFAALLPTARTLTIDGYFLFEKSLDIDSFLKTSVGYSLQAAAIFLFFQWAITYGLYALFVPLAWSMGYVISGIALRSGKFDGLLESRPPSSIHTIHGYVGEKMNCRWSAVGRLAILLLSLATILGIGGTLMAEVDYAASFFMKATQISDHTPLR